MILIAAVKKGGGEGIKAEFGSFLRGCFKTGEVAVVTTLCRVLGNCGKKLFKLIFIPVDHLQSLAAANSLTAVRRR